MIDFLKRNSFILFIPVAVIIGVAVLSETLALSGKLSGAASEKLLMLFAAAVVVAEILFILYLIFSALSEKNNTVQMIFAGVIMSAAMIYSLKAFDGNDGMSFFVCFINYPTFIIAGLINSAVSFLPFSNTHIENIIYYIGSGSFSLAAAVTAAVLSVGRKKEKAA